MTIQPFQLEDIDQLAALQPDGWGPLEPPFIYNVQSPKCYPLKAVIDHKIIGLGNIIMNEHSAWLSQIIVHPSHRKQGIGQLITQSLIDHLDQQDCPSILLDATKFGFPVYRKAGFETVTEHLHFEGPLLAEETAISPFIRPFKDTDRDAVLHADFIATGERRTAILEEHLGNALVYAILDEVEGAYFPDLGRGLIIADNPVAGIELMKARLKTYNFAMFPVENKEVADFLLSTGYVHTNTSTRMIRGQRLNWKLQNIYNVINGARG